jgi:hypothetical protein
MTLIPTASRLSVCARASHTDDTITITAVRITRVALNIKKKGSVSKDACEVAAEDLLRHLRLDT